MIDTNAPLDLLGDRRDEASRLRAENAAKTTLLLQKEGEIKVLRKRLEAAEAKRDRAVADITHGCDTCIRCQDCEAGTEPECAHCYGNVDAWNTYEDSWDWRGQQAGGERKRMIKVPDECYHEYGADLDGCSTQEREGCGSCVLARRVATKADHVRAMSDMELAVFLAKVDAALYRADLPVIAYRGATVNDNLDWLRKPAGGES